MKNKKKHKIEWKGLPCIPKVVLLESKEALNDQKCDE